MFRNYFLLNLLLVLIITFLGTRLYAVLTTQIEIPTEAPAETSPEYETKPAAKPVEADISSYDVILSKNLFHPSRSINEKPVKTAALLSKNEIPQLFGTVIMDEKKLAILQDRSTKKSKLYRVNDSVSGFTIYKILENKVLLQKGGESIEVSLRTDKKFTPPRPRQPAIRKAPKPRRQTSRVRRSTSQRRRPLERRIRTR